MAVTRLKRKGRRNKVVAKQKVANAQRLSKQPIIKGVDVEAMKAEFAAAASKPKAAAKAEKTEEVKAEAVVAEEKPKKAAAKKTADAPAAEKKAPAKKAAKKTEE